MPRGHRGVPAQVEELSGQQAEAALRAEKWHLEFRHLQERFEALSQEKEVGEAWGRSWGRSWGPP